jgi:hypothetical protein
MNKLAFALLLAVIGTVHAADKDTVYQFKMKDIDGKTVSLSKYKGKVLMIVNVASKCGHTPQYADLSSWAFPATNSWARSLGPMPRSRPSALRNTT